MALAALTIPLAYLLGCFNTGYYLVRLRTGQDIRGVSSGNAGSRNVGRLLGAGGFIVTFIGDAGKGAAAVWLVRHAGGDHLLATVALLAVIAGHIWPVQLGFRGGKGFATFAGGMIFLAPWVLLSGLAVSAAAYPAVRGTTKAGLAALALSPAIMVVLRGLGSAPESPAEIVLYSLLVGMVLYAHRANIRKEFFSSGTNAAPGA